MKNTKLIYDIIPCEHVLGQIDGDNQAILCRICNKIITKTKYAVINKVAL